MILLTNDDGIGSPGIECARRFLGGSGEEVVVVAPHEPVSQCGHSITTDTPMRLEELGETIFALEGKPADCVRVGLTVVLKEEQPRWVVSGLNYGANLGVDVFVSGTVAAAREAALLGVNAVAFSIYYRDPIDLASDFDMGLMERVWKWMEGKELAEGEFWNVNFPHPVAGGEGREPAIVECAPSRRPLPVVYERKGERLEYRGVFSLREHEAGSDVAVCFGGDIAVSRLGVSG